MTASPRALKPDYLRLFALFGGIVVVNVRFIAFPALDSFVSSPSCCLAGKRSRQR